MKKILVILSLLVYVSANAQSNEAKVTAAMKEFHQALIKQDRAFLNAHADDALSYGHSSGWIQNKADLTKDFETGKISYQAIKEDSIQVSMGENIANVRFAGDYTVSSNGGSSSVIHLKVLEVWLKKKDQWVLFARQAIR